MAANLVELSVVLPVYREQEVIPALAERCFLAALQTGLTFEVVFVDDASDDATPDKIRALPAKYRGRLVQLSKNRGQFGATQRGLLEARGELVVVLDGDLQDPPEIIPALVAAHRRLDACVAPGRRATFAVKRSRHDPSWFVAGRAVFDVLQRTLGGSLVPRGAGSYCALDRQLAQQVAQVSFSRANLSSVVVALGGSGSTVPYAKQPRYDGHSRVGFLGLCAEAAGSLLLVSPLGRYFLRRAVR